MEVISDQRFDAAHCIQCTVTIVTIEDKLMEKAKKVVCSNHYPNDVTIFTHYHQIVSTLGKFVCCNHSGFRVALCQIYFNTST